MIWVSLRRAKAATRTVTTISMANSRSTSLRWSTTESIPALQISLPRESVLPEQNRSWTWSNWLGSRSFTGQLADLAADAATLLAGDALGKEDRHLDLVRPVPTPEVDLLAREQGDPEQGEADRHDDHHGACQQQVAPEPPVGLE